MVILEIIERLEKVNREQKDTLEQLHQQFEDLAKEPRFSGLPLKDIENLFSAYLKTWIKTNNEVIDLLRN